MEICGDVKSTWQRCAFCGMGMCNMLFNGTVFSGFYSCHDMTNWEMWDELFHIIEMANKGAIISGEVLHLSITCVYIYMANKGAIISGEVLDLSIICVYIYIWQTKEPSSPEKY